MTMMTTKLISVKFDLHLGKWQGQWKKHGKETNKFENKTVMTSNNVVCTLVLGHCLLMPLNRAVWWVNRMLLQLNGVWRQFGQSQLQWKTG